MKYIDRPKDEVYSMYEIVNLSGMLYKISELCLHPPFKFTPCWKLVLLDKDGSPTTEYVLIALILTEIREEIENGRMSIMSNGTPVINEVQR